MLINIRLFNVAKSTKNKIFINVFERFLTKIIKKRTFIYTLMFNLICVNNKLKFIIVF